MNTYKHIVFSLVLGVCLTLGLLLLLGGVLPTVRAAPGELFVTPGGGGDCAQATPCDLETALAQANDGDTVYVAQGTYTGAGAAVVTVTKSITLYGGWDGTPTTPVVRDPDVHVTTLDGEGQRRVMRIAGPVTVTLEGLTLAHGKIISTATEWNGAGLYARNVTLTLRNTHVYSNATDVYDVASSYAYGGGVYVEGGTLQVANSNFWGNSTWAKSQTYGGGLAISDTLTATVTGSLFQNNDAWQASGLYFLGRPGDAAALNLSDSTFVGNGLGESLGSAYGGYAGAVRIDNAHARITDNVFRNSRATNDYGTVSVSNGDLYFARNAITENQCRRTSGLYLRGVSPFTVTNNIIAGNRSSFVKSSAVRAGNSDGGFLHNTVVDNENIYGYPSSGFQIDGGATVALTNTIVVSNALGITVTQGSTASLEHTFFYAHSEGDTGGLGAITNTHPITGQDPLLTADYHLWADSPAIDAGVNAGVTLDIDGDGRPNGAGYDVGADEFYRSWNSFLPLVWR